MALIGYARVSTDEQEAALQVDALTAAGCERVFIDKASGVKSSRPGLDEALNYLRADDLLVVWKLDRLGRRLRNLVELINALAEAGVGFRSLTESIDTSSPSGQLLFHIMGALAQFERDLIRERTCAGLQAARARGRGGGRPIVVTPRILSQAKLLLRQGLTVKEAAARLRLGKTTLYDALRRASNAQ